MGNGSIPFLIFPCNDCTFIILFEIPGEVLQEEKEEENHEYDCFNGQDCPKPGYPAGIDTKRRNQSCQISVGSKKESHK